jgi:hypothetical protein
MENNLERMRYDEYLAAGYPIASGVIEGACRHLVKDRMERTGMRWREPSAGAMLYVRALEVTDLWEPFQIHRQAAERKRLQAVAIGGAWRPAGVQIVATIQVVLQRRVGIIPGAKIVQLATDLFCPAARRVRKEREVRIRLCRLRIFASGRP